MRNVADIFQEYIEEKRHKNPLSSVVAAMERLVDEIKTVQQKNLSPTQMAETQYGGPTGRAVELIEDLDSLLPELRNIVGDYAG
ncbi:MAG: hypothetical protein HC888_08935 [Candidatus Competibacteraceae bacterium]|nr:hypothetical protein [Candidatus Competibacteraceae bacterium]